MSLLLSLCFVQMLPRLCRGEFQPQDMLHTKCVFMSMTSTWKESFNVMTGLDRTLIYQFPPTDPNGESVEFQVLIIISALLCLKETDRIWNNVGRYVNWNTLLLWRPIHRIWLPFIKRFIESFEREAYEKACVFWQSAAHKPQLSKSLTKCSTKHLEHIVCGIKLVYNPHNRWFILWCELN